MNFAYGAKRSEWVLSAIDKTLSETPLTEGIHEIEVRVKTRTSQGTGHDIVARVDQAGHTLKIKVV